MKAGAGRIRSWPHPGGLCNAIRATRDLVRRRLMLAEMGEVCVRR